jgi:hypothetical protein
MDVAESEGRTCDWPVSLIYRPDRERAVYGLLEMQRELREYDTSGNAVKSTKRTRKHVQPHSASGALPLS